MKADASEKLIYSHPVCGREQLWLLTLPYRKEISGNILAGIRLLFLDLLLQRSNIVIVIILHHKLHP